VTQGGAHGVGAGLDVRRGLSVGDACLIGYETGPEPNFSSSSIGGLRRDGSCLGR